MAMKELVAGIVSYEVDLRCRVARHAYGALHHARGRLVTNLGDLKAVAMQMYRVLVTAIVGHPQTIRRNSKATQVAILQRPPGSVDLRRKPGKIMFYSTESIGRV